MAFPLVCAIWTATRYHSLWYYYDEWLMIERSMGGWHGILEGHQGHLAVENYLVYRAQRAWFGLEGHELVYLGLISSLAALQLSVAAVLRRLGLPTLIALLVGTMITFFGPGAGDAVHQFQQNINFALALSFLAGFVALREEHTRGASLAIAGLLVLAAVSDSGLAILGTVFVGILLVLLWPRRLALLALAPPLAVHAAWYFLGEPGSAVDLTWHAMWTFAFQLLTFSAAGLVGVGERPPTSIGQPNGASLIPLDTTVAGTILLLLATALVAFGFLRHRLSRRVIATFLGGVGAAICSVGVLAKTRGYIAPDAFPGSRYTQWTALFLLVGFVPAIAATVRPANQRAQRWATAAGAIFLFAVFIANLSAFNAAARYIQGWSQSVETSVRETVAVVQSGCGKGQEIVPSALPSGGASPQITVALIRDLLEDGALTADFGIPASRETRDLVCAPTRSRTTGSAASQPRGALLGR